MLLAWRFSRTFASRFNFANVVFFLPAKGDLPVVHADRSRRAEHGFPAGERATSPGKGSRVHTGRGFDAASRGAAPAQGRPRMQVLATDVAALQSHAERHDAAAGPASAWASAGPWSAH